VWRAGFRSGSLPQPTVRSVEKLYTSPRIKTRAGRKSLILLIISL
jgi:hypothetical protein